MGSLLGHMDSLAVACRLSCSVACGILVLQPGIDPTSPALQDGFLTTGPGEIPSKSILMCIHQPGGSGLNILVPRWAGRALIANRGISLLPWAEISWLFISVFCYYLVVQLFQLIWWSVIWFAAKIPEVFLILLLELLSLKIKKKKS